MRISRVSSFYVFMIGDGFVHCIPAGDEYWSTVYEFTDYPVAVVRCSFEKYIWTDRVI